MIMKHLTQRQLRPLLHAMDRREQDLRTRIGEERERATSEGYQQLEGMVGDDADKAFVETSVDLESVMIDRQLKELGDIEAARARVAEGTFGGCIDCGGTIEYERLRAYPPAVRCAECQMLHENPGARAKT
jgi:RNA polymerase-binding protein DksA